MISPLLRRRDNTKSLRLIYQSVSKRPLRVTVLSKIPGLVAAIEAEIKRTNRAENSPSLALLRRRELVVMLAPGGSVCVADPDRAARALRSPLSDSGDGAGDPGGHSGASTPPAMAGSDHKGEARSGNSVRPNKQQQQQQPSAAWGPADDGGMYMAASHMLATSSCPRPASATVLSLRFFLTLVQ